MLKPMSTSWLSVFLIFAVLCLTGAHVLVCSTLSADLNSIRDRVSHMFVNLHDWTLFSNHTANPGTNSDSLESIHDTMHKYVASDVHLRLLFDIT